jgi:hypothetical protein
MKLRVLSILSVVLAIACIAAWIWLGRDDGQPATPNPAESAGSAESARTTTTAKVADHGSPAVPVAPKKTLSEPAKESGTQPAPVRVTTSVVPGMPMVRSTPPPPRPVDPAIKAHGVAALESRPDWQVQGTAALAKVQAMLRDYRTRMGENPVGSNAEIMKAVMGGNPVGARLGPTDGQGINEQGELVDQWGTPYFFHQLSKNSMEVRSAGPDRKMWTPDDLVAK